MRMRNNMSATIISTLILLLSVTMIIVPICVGVVYFFPAVTLTELFLGLIATAVIGILLGVISLW